MHDFKMLDFVIAANYFQRYFSHIVILYLLCGYGKAVNLEEELRITPAQKELMDKLRHEVEPFIIEPLMKDELHLIRWLRASKYDVGEAKKRMFENIKWRKENRIGNIIQEDFSDIEEDYPYVYTTDKQEQPTFICFAGEWDIRKAVITGRAGRVIRFINQKIEESIKQIRQLQLAGKNATRSNLIIDLSGFNVVQHACVGCLFRILDFLYLYDNHYPGLVDHVIFTNAPPTIAVTADLIKNNANSITWAAVKIYNNDRPTWIKALYSFMSPDKLPNELGGKRPRSSFTTINQQKELSKL